MFVMSDYVKDMIKESQIRHRYNPLIMELIGQDIFHLFLSREFKSRRVNGFGSVDGIVTTVRIDSVDDIYFTIAYPCAFQDQYYLEENKDLMLLNSNDLMQHKADLTHLFLVNPSEREEIIRLYNYQPPKKSHQLKLIYSKPT